MVLSRSFLNKGGGVRSAYDMLLWNKRREKMRGFQKKIILLCV
ncbi:hypothetical protein HMPREF3034_00680 [Prevotella sp. DNF00663]|nr:hypothetical protein HMPREF3034_00680 [Prevotella sp. DNF00663]